MWCRSLVRRSQEASAQVRGLGGIGKSLLAEEYALRFGAAYPGGIFWLRAYGNDDAKLLAPTRSRSNSSSESLSHGLLGRNNNRTCHLEFKRTRLSVSEALPQFVNRRSDGVTTNQPRSGDI